MDFKSYLSELKAIQDLKDEIFKRESNLKIQIESMRKIKYFNLRESFNIAIKNCDSPQEKCIMIDLLYSNEQDLQMNNIYPFIDYIKKYTSLKFCGNCQCFHDSTTTELEENSDCVIGRIDLYEFSKSLSKDIQSRRSESNYEYRC